MDTPAHSQLHAPQTNRNARIGWYHITNKAWDGVNTPATLWVTMAWGFNQDQARFFEIFLKRGWGWGWGGSSLKKPDSSSQVFNLINNPAFKLHNNSSKISPRLLLPKALKAFKSTLWNVLCNQKPWIMGSLVPSVCLPRLPSSPLAPQLL